MDVLITKFYRYDQVSKDPRFSLEIAFKRLNRVLEVASEVAPDKMIRIIIPGYELQDARRYVKLDSNTQMCATEEALAKRSFFNSNREMLIFDEQAFYVSSELVQEVIKRSQGKACTWSDPDRLLWSFNYSDSCRFFIAPSSLVKKHLKGAGSFLELQNAVFEEAAGCYYIVTPSDILPIYKRAAKFNPYPYHYCIEPTSRCNSGCIMCPFHSSDPEIAKGRLYLGDGGDDMPLETFRRLVDEIASLGWNYLPNYRLPQITAQLRGEPTLAPGCKEMFAYVKEKGFRLSFSTNGSTLHENGMAEFLLDIGMDEIIVSIDGDEEEYSRIRPQLNYGQVVKNLETLRRLRDRKGMSIPTLYVKRVRLRNSSNEADKNYLRKFLPLVDWAGLAFVNYDDPETECKRYSDFFFDVEIKKRLPCLWATDVAVVKANGLVDMCFGASEHYIGNVNERPLLEILKESRLRKDILESQSTGRFGDMNFCKNCTSWKANYNRSFKEDDCVVQMNPILAYWKKETTGVK